MDPNIDIEALQRRITRLEDIEAIRQLKARYCAICDDNHNPDRIVTIFAPDGIWEGRGIGRAEGHAELRALFENFGRLMSFSMHMAMNPVIEVDGDRATGTWYFLGPFTFRDGNQARWQATCYQEDYVRLDGTWKYQHLRVVQPGFSARYETGWARQHSGKAG